MDPAANEESKTKEKTGGTAAVPIHRVQSNKACCFVGAPALAHRYALQKMGAPKDLMLDYSLYMRDYLSEENFTQYIIHGNGSSISIFKDLVRKSFEDVKFISVSKEIMERNLSYVLRLLHNCGEGLVSEFSVESKFFDAENPTSFDGTIDPDSVVGTHAMVLLKMRYDGKVWRLLLQNTWKTCCFVDMTVQYFLSANPKLTFVEAKRMKANDGLPTNNYKYSEIDFEGCDVSLA